MSRYQTPQALRRALEDRLLALVRREGGDINRLRRQTAFDRLLCRLFREANAPWLLKGGYAMELRIQAARTTRDIDLAIRQLPGGAREWDEAAIRNLLENAAGFDLGDSFEFIIGEPTMDLDAAPYGGSRYPVDAQMAGRRFAQFHLDVSAGDVLREPYEILEGRDWLGFRRVAESESVRRLAGRTIRREAARLYPAEARPPEHARQRFGGLGFVVRVRHARCRAGPREHRGHFPPSRDASCSRNTPSAPGSMAGTIR